MYSAIPSAHIVTSALKHFGVTQVVISPGSRNAPLIMNIVADESFKAFSVVDERSAAFFAIGRAQATKQAVALLCTSGSALLNYYPAIAEAYYSEIPLLVLSADRPPEMVDIGDGQTIRQPNVFASLLGNSFTLSLDRRVIKQASDFDPSMPVNAENVGILIRALSRLQSKRIPVHINIPFEEPLYHQIDAPVGLINWRPYPTDIASDSKEESSIDGRAVQQLTSAKVMLLIGVWDPSEVEKDQLRTLIQRTQALVLTETLSNTSGLDCVDSIDTLIAPLESHDQGKVLLEKLKPNVILTIGGMVVSKKIKALLRSINGLQHIHLGNTAALNTYGCLNGHYDLGDFSQASVNLLNNDTTYAKFWMDYYHHLVSKRADFISAAPFSDFKAFSQALEAIPEAYELHISNSSAIRYAQFFYTPAKKQWCNRGTSGIEGSASTAVGYSSVEMHEKTVLLTGDLSFFYDTNAYWNAYVPSSFRIIVINNSGGGIFRILSNAKNTNGFETYLETRHDKKAEEIAKHFDFEYLSVADIDSLAQALGSFFEEGKRPKLLEVFTPSNENEEVLFDYFKSLK
jgi:2-succinyl-5-enolpyruvyl-6-hydroxy-3-cyclohexene-1-carboxylate synthase